MTTYTICYSPLNWNDHFAWDHAKPQYQCDHKHRSVATAARCLDTLQRTTERATGMRLNVRIGASDGNGFRPLTQEEAYDAWLIMPIA